MARKPVKTPQGYDNAWATPLEADAPAEPVAPVEPEKSPNIVTNCMSGTTLSLGDGRSIGFGESAEVAEELAAFLRERGQVE